MKNLKISIYLKNQSLESAPAHRINSAAMADFFVAEGAKRISGEILQLKAGQDFKELKARFRRPIDHGYIPAILPPRRPFGLILTYPCPDLRSGAAR